MCVDVTKKVIDEYTPKIKLEVVLVLFFLVLRV